MPTTSTSYESPETANAKVADTPDLAADANAVMGEAKATAGKIVDEVKDQVSGLAERAKDELGATTDKAKSLASDQKDMLADEVGTIATAIGKAASDLEQSNSSSAQYARMLADKADELSSAIRDNDVDQLLGLAQDFGRRQPLAFMGAAAVLGFAASRFAKASASRREGLSPASASAIPAPYEEYPGEPMTNSIPGKVGGSDVSR